jgi:hypothetical protein
MRRRRRQVQPVDRGVGAAQAGHRAQEQLLESGRRSAAQRAAHQGRVLALQVRR